MVPQQIQIAGRYAARPSRRRVFPLLAVPPIAAGITSTSAGGNQTMNN
jgi:hypothetical protein